MTTRDALTAAGIQICALAAFVLAALFLHLLCVADVPTGFRLLCAGAAWCSASVFVDAFASAAHAAFGDL